MMDAKEYLENLFYRLQNEYLEAVKNERANDKAAYFWGVREGLQLAQNIAFAHLQQFKQAEKERHQKIQNILSEFPGLIGNDEREGR
jgi:hypothetical protein